VQEFTTKGGLGRGYGRFESGNIAKSMGPAISLDLLLVHFQDFIQRKEHRLHEGRSADY
jgi:hypothetical protein